MRGTLAALQPTHTARTQPHRPLINHVDWGLPYAARAYVALRIAQRGDQYENAVAERVNGTPKDEFDLDSTLSGFAQVDTLVTCTVRVYNALLPHGSCDFLTPSQAHEQKGPLVRRWKNYYQPVDPAPTRRAVRAAE
ncbi:MAG: integrase core domain-containing protein [Janthinobacterium lividum]